MALPAWGFDTTASRFAMVGDYRNAMSYHIRDLARAAREADEDFLVVAENVTGLITQTGLPNGPVNRTLMDAVDGFGQKPLYFGEPQYGAPITPEVADSHADLLSVAREAGKTVLVTDFTWYPPDIMTGRERCRDRGFLYFAAFAGYGLNFVPPYPANPFGLNGRSVTRLDQARNFLYLIDSSRFNTQTEYVDSLANTTFDLLIVDPFHLGVHPLARDDIRALQEKPNGARRLVLAYFNMAAAETFRPYWQDSWTFGGPDWVVGEMNEARRPNQVLVEFWSPEWADLLYRNEDAYLKHIQDLGFDGIYVVGGELVTRFLP